MSCPDEEQLLAFSDGRVPDGPREQLALHLEGCETCREVIAALASDGIADTLPTFRLPETPLLATGERVDRYVIVDTLGQGGMSVVYVAYDPELDRKIALKMLRASLLERLGPDANSRALREGQAMAKLSHPNVLHVHDVGTHHNAVFLAMEFVDGVNLREWLAAATRSRRDILQRFISAGDGLVAAHAVGLVHRDFKPENVLIGRDGRVRVADFGLVRAFTDGHDPLSGAIAGTPAYMAPEQRRGEEVDSRSDQFSYCLSLHEALTGERGVHRSRHPRIPRWLHPILQRGLSERPQDRFPSMADVVTELRKGLSGRATRRFAFSAAAILGVAAFSALSWGREPHTGCAEAETRLVGVWDNARADAVKASFERSGKSYAPDLYTRVASALFDFDRRFRKSWRAACEADRAARTDTARQIAALSMLCLDAQREELRVVVEDFVAIDQKLLDKSVDVARGLPDPAVCVDSREIEQRHGRLKKSLPPQQAQPLILRLSKLRAQTREGRFEEAMATAEALVADARPLNDPFLFSEIRFAQGFLLSDAWKPAEAEVALKEAFDVAMAAGADEIAARSALELTCVIGYAQERTPEGRQWQTVAQAAVKRVGSPPMIEARLWNCLGHLEWFVGDVPRSTAAYERALELRKVAFGERSPEYAATLFNIGRNLGQMGQWDVSLQKTNQAVVLLEEILGRNHPKLAIALNGTAWSAAQSARLQLARTLSERAVHVAEESSGADSLLAADVRSVLGTIHYWQGDYVSADEASQRSMPVLISGGRASLAAVSGSVRCRALLGLSRGSDAMSACDEMIKLSESGEELDPAEVAALHEVRGSVLLELGKAAEAEAAFDRALKLRSGAKIDELPARAGLARCALLRKDVAGAKKLLDETPKDPPGGASATDLDARAGAMIAIAQVLAASGDRPGANAKLDQAQAVLGGEQGAFPAQRARLAAVRKELSL